MIELLEAKEENGKIIFDKDKFTEFIEEVDNAMETLEILSDKEMIEQIKESEKDIKEGRIKEIKSDGELKKMLGI